MLREGVSYKAWVRFSNANHEPQSDHVPDARGMSVKLIGVPDDNEHENNNNKDGRTRTQVYPCFFVLLCWAYNIVAQDFVASTTEVHPIGDALSSVEYLRAASVGYWPMLKFMFPSFNPFTWRIKYTHISC